MNTIIIDRVRFERAWRGLRVAGRVALAIVKSAANFAGACGTIVCFGIAAGNQLIKVRKPDPVLLKQALVRAHDTLALAHPSAAAERDDALALLAISAMLIFCGALWLRAWWRALGKIREAAK